jgi:hypothetical protein
MAIPARRASSVDPVSITNNSPTEGIRQEGLRGLAWAA